MKGKSDKEANRFKNEEEIYNVLAQDIEAFYGSVQDQDDIFDLKSEFIDNYRLLWLYAPDEIIKSVNEFLIQSGGSQPSESPQTRAFRESILGMRKRMIKNTSLEPSDFLIVIIARPPD